MRFPSFCEFEPFLKKLYYLIKIGTHYGITIMRADFYLDFGRTVDDYFTITL